MNIDVLNEIRYNLKIFSYILRKKKINEYDLQELIVLIDNIKGLLEFYLYDYLDY